MTQVERKGIVVVTGASSGIGRATALGLDALGYRVIAGVRQLGDARLLHESASERLLAIRMDVTSADDVREAARIVRELAGGDGVLALVNNAGCNYNSAFEYSVETEARQMMEVNFFGLVRMSQAFIPLLRAHAQRSGGRAKLINVGSIGSVVGLPWESFYHASKFAVLGLTQSLRHELHAQRISAMAVLPGGIRTEFMRKTVASVGRALGVLDQQGRNLYEQRLQSLLHIEPLVSRWGSKPEKVADRIARIVRAPAPAAQYLVGPDAYLIFALARLLPECAFHALLRPVFRAS